MRMPARLVATLVLAASSAAAATISTDRSWQVLAPAGDLRRGLAQAAEKLGERKLQLFEETIDGPLLRELAVRAPGEPVTRVVREALRRPVDVEDFLFFLDDLLAAPGLDLAAVWIPSGRARNAGILLHPDDVFGTAPRRYGGAGELDVSRPPDPLAVEPAADGEPLGPRWTGRFPNPDTEDALLASLERARPRASFARRIRALLKQLRAQGAECWVQSADRSRARGYLMWGAYEVSRAASEEELRRRVDLLERRNREWGLDVPIRWLDPRGWQPTVAAGREMAEAYAVVFATENGAKQSRHYGGKAVDFTAVGLPRSLRLEAPDGARRAFDLAAPASARDVSLEPAVVEWAERHFGLRKVRGDYPHWEDAR